MAEEQEWYYMHGEQQLGPVSADDLQLLAGGGSITPETQLWTEGLEEWVPASRVEGLFPDPQAEPHPHLVLGPEAQAAHPLPGEIVRSDTAATPVPQVAASSSIPVAGTVIPPVAAHEVPVGQPGMIAPPGTDYPTPGPMRASFGKLLAFPLLAILCLTAGIIVVILRAARAAQAAASSSASPEDLSKMFLEAGAVLISSSMGFALCFLIFKVLKMIALHRAWRCLQFGGARTTPGKAVGLLFVPLFNLYWIFVAYLGLAKDWNRIHAQHPNLVGAPRISEGLVATYCIFIIILFLGRLATLGMQSEDGTSPLAIPILVVWLITLVLELIFLGGVCRLVNFMGQLHLRQTQPRATGMRLY